MRRVVYPTGSRLREPYLTTAQAAKYLGLAPATVQRMGQEYDMTDGRMGLRRSAPDNRLVARADLLLFERRRVAVRYIIPILEAIRRYAHGRGVMLVPMRLNLYCPVAAGDHRIRPRYMAHAFHTEWAGQGGICMVPEIAKQPVAVAAGVTLHEVGHVMCRQLDPLGAEPSADQWVRDRLGIDIHYSPKTTVQYLDRAALRALRLA